MGNSDKTTAERINMAAAHANNQKLFNNFNLLSKHAQTFLLMQLKNSTKARMARRYTMEEKLNALILLKQSPKNYRLLEKMFILPSKRTINRLAENVNVQPGINVPLFKYMQSKIKHWQRNDKLCTIVFDEVALTPHLTYDPKHDVVYGFTDVVGERQQKFADHALTFMLRGICSSWRQTVAFYFVEGTISAAALENILKQLIDRIAESGLIPLGIVCDQGSTFRSMFKSIRETTLRYRNLNGIADGKSTKTNRGLYTSSANQNYLGDDLF